MNNVPIIIGKSQTFVNKIVVSRRLAGITQPVSRINALSRISISSARRITSARKLITKGRFNKCECGSPKMKANAGNSAKPSVNSLVVHHHHHQSVGRPKSVVDSIGKLGIPQWPSCRFSTNPFVANRLSSPVQGAVKNRRNNVKMPATAKLTGLLPKLFFESEYRSPTSAYTAQAVLAPADARAKLKIIPGS